MLSYRVYGILIITPYLLLAITFHMYLQPYEKTPIITHRSQRNNQDKNPPHSMETNLQHKSNFFPLKDADIPDKTASKINLLFIHGNDRHGEKDRPQHRNKENSINNGKYYYMEKRTKHASNRNDKVLGQKKLAFNGINKEWGYPDVLKRDLIHQSVQESHAGYRFRDLRLEHQTLKSHQSQDELQGHSKGGANLDLQQNVNLQVANGNKLSSALDGKPTSKNKSKRNSAVAKKAPRIRIKNSKAGSINGKDVKRESSRGKVNYPSEMRDNVHRGHTRNDPSQTSLNEINNTHVENSILDKSIRSAVSGSYSPATTNHTGDTPSHRLPLLVKTPQHNTDTGNKNNDNYKPQRLSGDLNRKLRTSSLLRELGLDINHMQRKPPWNSNFPLQDHCHQMSTADRLDSENVHFQSLRGNYIYSAYLDERFDPAVVRIFTVIKSLNRPQLFCHFPKYIKPSLPLSTHLYESVAVHYYEMCENHGKIFGGWLLTCDIPSEMLDLPPCYVTISTHSKYRPTDSENLNVTVFTTSPAINYTVMLSSLNSTDQVFHKHTSDSSDAPMDPIINTNKSKRGVSIHHYNNSNLMFVPPHSQVDVYRQKQDFGICVPPLFGYIPSTTLIEFIELSRLLGANHITFYIHTASGEIRRVLNYYEREGLVTTLPWKLPLNDEQIWYHGQLLAINDCLYRSMHRFKYVAFNDLDEFIVPKNGVRKWLDMMHGFHDDSSQSQYCGYTFQSAFFDPISSSARLLYDLESDLRTKSFSKVRTKVMVIPDRIYELGIHHISRPVHKTLDIYYVNNTQAYIHHYRQCMTDYDPKMNCQIYARDESLFHYIPTLRHNVHKTTWILKEKEKQHESDHKNNIKVRHIL